MKILKALVWIIGLLLLLFLVLLAVAPVNLHIERTVTINAPAAKVWDHIVKFERFNEWSTWKKMDPSAKYTITGQDGTTGAVDAWKGEKIGEGRLEHISLEPYRNVRQRLSFLKPWAMTSDVYFNLEETNAQTAVRWGFDARYERPKNIMTLFMKGALEKDFDEGLQNLKKQVEAAP